MPLMAATYINDLGVRNGDLVDVPADREADRTSLMRHGAPPIALNAKSLGHLAVRQEQVKAMDGAPERLTAVRLEDDKRSQNKRWSVKRGHRGASRRNTPRAQLHDAIEVILRSAKWHFTVRDDDV